MKVTTTYHREKPFTWSYSRLKNFEACPAKYYAVDVAKTVKEPQSDALLWGNQLHAAFANRLGPKHTTMPSGFDEYEAVAARVEKIPGKHYVEQKLAITEKFGPCGYFDKNVWFRGIGDFIAVNGKVAFAIDWKTGKVVEDSQQLALLAACIFAHYPEVQAVRTEFWWLKDHATSRADFKRNEMADMWKGLWPRIETLKFAHQTTQFPAKPGGLCAKWCAVKSCPHNGG